MSVAQASLASRSSRSARSLCLPAARFIFFHRSSRTSQRHFGKPLEASRIRAHDLSLAGPSRRRDDQIVRAAGPAAASSVGEQDAMRPRHIEVVGLDRDRLQDRGKKPLPLCSPLAIGQLDSDRQLGDADRGDCHVVLISDQLLQRPRALALGIDQSRRVEDQSRQCSGGDPTLSRNSRNSPAHAASGRCARSASLSARPVPPPAGPIVATARPWRTTTYDSPSPSTLSSTSENRRAASVALTCFTESDYQIPILRLAPSTPASLKLLTASLLVLLGALVLAPSVQAAFAIDTFTASATNQNATPTTQAGAHPYQFKTEVDLHTDGGASDGDLRDLRLTLPPGFLLNPTATAPASCGEALFHKPRSSPFEAGQSGESCPNASQLGVLEVNRGGTTRHFGLFSLDPPFGSAAAIGASPFGVPLVFEVHLREPDIIEIELEELPQSFDLQSLGLTIWGTPWLAAHDAQRGNCLKQEDGGTWTPSAGEQAAAKCLVFETASAPESQIRSYFTMPTTPCGQALAFSALATSWQGSGASSAASAPALVKCNKALATPKVQLMTDAAAARTGLAFNLAVNDGGGILNPGGIARPAIKTAVLSLPEGLTINPSLGAGLGTCTEAEFARETALSEPGSGCPNSSKIGDVTVEGALGLAEPLKGSVYLARPYENQFHNLIALYLVSRNASRGIILKSVGKLDPDPGSGRLVATFEGLPRLLYQDFSLTLREGQRSTLVSPPSCGAFPSDMALASWATPATFAHQASTFLISRGPSDGPCPGGGALPFSPGLLGGSINPSPATYTPLHLRMTRSDGEQEITSYSATLPPGLLASLRGVSSCPDAAIEAAKLRSGLAEQATPSCPAGSQVGRTLAGYGVGAILAWAPGNLYLAGPYHGAPLSIVAVDSALIGPFDLGVVVVRSAIRVDPRSAQVSIDSAASDPIPHILAGIPLHLRDIRVFVERPTSPSHRRRATRWRSARG